MKGPYQYDPSLPLIPHHHPVDWLSTEQWELPKPEAKGRAIRELRIVENQVEIERKIYFAPPVGIGPVTPPVNIIPRSKAFQGRIQSVLERKKQVILYGPPGTGKTYWARNAALDLAAYAMFGDAFFGLAGWAEKANPGRRQLHRRAGTNVHLPSGLWL